MIASSEKDKNSNTVVEDPAICKVHSIILYEVSLAAEIHGQILLKWRPNVMTNEFGNFKQEVPWIYKGGGENRFSQCKRSGHFSIITKTFWYCFARDIWTPWLFLNLDILYFLQFLNLQTPLIKFCWFIKNLSICRNEPTMNFSWRVNYLTKEIVDNNMKYSFCGSLIVLDLLAVSFTLSFYKVLK